MRTQLFQRSSAHPLTTTTAAAATTAARPAARIPAAATSPRLPLSTYAGQRALPSLPVPPLAATLAKYVRTLEPLNTPQALERARKCIYSVQNTAALERLHARLVVKSQSSRNWLERWWDGDQYLKPRLELPINYNYFLRFKDELHPDAGLPARVGGVQPRQISRAARLLTSMARFYVSLAAEEVHPDSDRGVDLDMNQYARLFGHARLPVSGHDRIACHTARPPGLSEPHYATEYAASGAPPRHVVVLSRGHYYSVDVLDDAYAPLSAQTIAHALTRLVTQTAVMGDAPHPIGVLTSMQRDAWAAARNELEGNSSATAASLQTVDSALWVLCLDDFAHFDSGAGGGGPKPSLPVVTQSVSARLSAESPWFLHGAGNRFFDKHQLIVLGDGTAGMLIEHAAVDGMTILRLMNFMWAAEGSAGGRQSSGGVAASAPAAAAAAAAASSPSASPSSSSSSSSTLGGVRFPSREQLSVDMSSVLAASASSSQAALLLHASASPRLLPMHVPLRTCGTLSAALCDLNAVSSALSTRVLHFAEFGAEEIKSRMKLPPDAFVQMAMQLAHQRLYGRPCATYESTATRGFAQGRTEVTRSASRESLALSTAMCASPPRTPSLVSRSTSLYHAALLGDACAAHARYAREAKAGMGVDRHLHGLLTLWHEEQQQQGHTDPLPPLFADPTYAASRHWRLSTSNCGSSSTALFGYGPVVDDGYGAGYVIGDDSITLNFTSWGARAPSASSVFAPLPCDPWEYATAVEAALRDLAGVGYTHALEHTAIYG